MSVKSTPARLRGWGPKSLGTAGLLLAGLLAFASPAAACDLAVETPAAVRIEYNPFAVGASSGPVDVLFQNRSDTACELRLLLVDDVGDPLPAVTLGGAVVGFRPREASGLFRRDTEPGAFVLTVAPNSTTRAEMDAVVLHDAVVEAGQYQGDLRLLIRSADGVPVPPPVPLRVILQSTPRAQVNIAGASGAFGSGSSVEVIDFGQAATGVTRRAFLQVRANTKATVSIRSEHHGVMRHLEMEEAGSVVAYQLELDGDPVDLTRVWTRSLDPPRTLAGVDFPLDFTLGTIAGQMSGRYEDLITIDITPN